MWFWLALASAVLGAIEIILAKRILSKVSGGLLAWSPFALTLPIIAAISLWQGAPSVNELFVFGVVGSSIFYVLARTIFNNALKDNLISQILPLTAFSGVFTYIFGLFLLSETLRPIPLLGLFIVITGSYILNVNQAKEDAFKPFKLLIQSRGATLILFSILLGSMTAVLDKLGVKNTTPENPTFVVFTEQILQSGLMTMYLLKTESKTWLNSLRLNFKPLFVISLIFLATSLLVLWSYIEGPVALVLGIKRMQIFFTLIMGYILLKDKPTTQAWIATLVMILGVFMIKMG